MTSEVRPRGPVRTSRLVAQSARTAPLRRGRTALPGALRVALVLASCMLGILGCGRTHQEPPLLEAPTTPTPSHEIARSKITMSDPEGQWNLEATAQRIEAASVSGPYELVGAECRYEPVDVPAIFMSADRASLDEDMARLTMEGNVSIRSTTWQLEGERIEYDLDTREVVSDERTKLTLVRDGAADPAPIGRMRERAHE
jgi:LPS export ABC transporter protein LptC